MRPDTVGPLFQTSQFISSVALHPLPLLGLLPMAFVACADRTPSTPDWTVRDSAGIQIVENLTPEWNEGQAWEIDPDPSLELGVGSNDPDEQLLGVGDVLVLESGQILVVNEALANVAQFDSAGRFVGVLGRRGEGPGEFRRIDGAYRCQGDTVVVDGFHQAAFFDPRGEFLKSQSLALTSEDGGSLRLQGASVDCHSFLFRSGYSYPELGTVGRVSYTLSWGSIEGGNRIPLPAVRGRAVEAMSVDGGVAPMSLPWGSKDTWTVGGDRLFLGISDRPEIQVIDQGGRLLRMIRWRQEAEPVSQVDRSLYSEKRERWLTKYPQVEEAVPRLEDFQVIPEVKPFLLSLLVDDEMNLWVRQYPTSVAGRPDLFDYSDPDAPFRENPEPGQEPERWRIFNPSGRLLGSVEIPAALALRVVRKGRIGSVWRDDLDVERVRFHRILRR